MSAHRIAVALALVATGCLETGPTESGAVSLEDAGPFWFVPGPPAAADLETLPTIELDPIDLSGLDPGAPLTVEPVPDAVVRLPPRDPCSALPARDHLAERCYESVWASCPSRSVSSPCAQEVAATILRDGGATGTLALRGAAGQMVGTIRLVSGPTTTSGAVPRLGVTGTLVGWGAVLVLAVVVYDHFQGPDDCTRAVPESLVQRTAGGVVAVKACRDRDSRLRVSSSAVLAAPGASPLRIRIEVVGTNYLSADMPLPGNTREVTVQPRGDIQRLVLCPDCKGSEADRGLSYFESRPPAP